MISLLTELDLFTCTYNTLKQFRVCAYVYLCDETVFRRTRWTSNLRDERHCNQCCCSQQAVPLEDVPYVD